MIPRTLLLAAALIAGALPASAEAAEPSTIRCEDGQAIARDVAGLPVIVGPCTDGVPLGDAPAVPAPAAAEPADCLVPGYDDRCELWTARFDGPNAGADYPGFGSFDRRQTIVTTGDIVIVGGTSTHGSGSTLDADFSLLAYRASTGQPVWTRTHDGVGAHTIAYLTGISLSPDHTRLYATGIAAPAGTSNYRSVVAAFDVATGDQLWGALPPNGGYEAVSSIVTLPDDEQQERIFLIGSALATPPGGGPVSVAAVTALDAEDGSPIWVSKAAVTPYGSRFNKIVVAPDGSAVYATGGEHDAGLSATNFLTVGFDTVSGAKLWEARDERTQPSSGNNGASGMAITPDGTRVLISGFDTWRSGSLLGGDSSGILTIAHEADDGEVAWRNTYLGPEGSDKDFYFTLFQGMLAVSPDGTTAVATAAINSNSGIGTVAYDVTTGAERWNAISDEPLHVYTAVTYLGYYPRVIVGDTRAYVSNRRGFGVSQYRTVTMAYGLSAGTLDWTGRLGVNRTLFGGSALTPARDRVIVAAADQPLHPGTVPNPGIDTIDIVTVAYQA